MTINPDGDAHGRPAALPFITPQRSDAGDRDRFKPSLVMDDHTVPVPEAKLYELFDRDDVPFEIHGRLLGYSSSRWEDHSHPRYFIDRGEFAPVLNDLDAKRHDLRTRHQQGSIPTNVFREASDQLESYRLLFHENFAGQPENIRRYAGQGDRCSACRWFELRIFSVEGEYSSNCSCGVANPDDPNTDHTIDCGLGPARARYLVLTYGRTEVPGEMNKRRAVWTDSPYEVLSLLTQRHRGSEGSRAPFLPATSDRALAQAAAHDSSIEKAYTTRRIR